MSYNIFSKATSVIAISSLALALFGGVVNTYAAGVTIATTPSTSAVATSGTVTLAYTAPANLPASSTIVVTRDSGYGATATSTVANVTVNGAAPSSVSSAVSGSNVVSTITTSAVITAGTVTVALGGFTSPSTAGNYAFLLRDSSNNFGGAFQYVGQANVVNVKAFVPISLSFVIRNAADTVNTNICDLGDQSTTAHTECAYRLKVATNAKNGYSISYFASGEMTDGTYNIAQASVGAAGSLIDDSTANTEKYGVTIAKGSVSGAGGVTSVPIAFDAGVTNAVQYNNTTATQIFNATKSNSPTATDLARTVKVTHKMNISSDTPSGAYTANYTYTVAPSF